MLLLAFVLEFFCIFFFPPFSSGLCQPDDSELIALFSALNNLGCILLPYSFGQKGINSRQNFIFLQLMKWKKKGMAEKTTTQRDACKQRRLAVSFLLCSSSRAPARPGSPLPSPFPRRRERRCLGLRAVLGERCL